MELSVQWWNKLLVVVCEPLEGFTHLVANPSECIEAYGQYHISVAQWPVATEEDFEALTARWAGRRVQLDVQLVSGDACLELAPSPLVEQVRAIHERPDACYAGRSIHIAA